MTRVGVGRAATDGGLVGADVTIGVGDAGGAAVIRIAVGSARMTVGVGVLARGVADAGPQVLVRSAQAMMASMR
jgi:hypothetical protein